MQSTRLAFAAAIAALVSLQAELEGWHRESSVRQRRGDGEEIGSRVEGLGWRV